MKYILELYYNLIYDILIYGQEAWFSLKVSQICSDVGRCAVATDADVSRHF